MCTYIFAVQYPDEFIPSLFSIFVRRKRKKDGHISVRVQNGRNVPKILLREASSYEQKKE